jgi:hypothetical protein
MNTKQSSLLISTGDLPPKQYASDMRHHLNTLLSLALAPNGLDLDQNELRALRAVSDLMLQLDAPKSSTETAPAP